MKILIATPLYPPDIGGPAKYAKELVGEFQKLGAESVVVVWGKLERALPWGIRHFTYFIKLLSRIGGVEAILALDTSSTGLPALWVARLSGKKLLVRVGGDMLWEGYIERTGKMIKLSEFYTQKRFLTRKEQILLWATMTLVRYADVLFFNTAWQMHIWQKAYGFNLSKARVLENVYLPVQASDYSGEKVFVAAGRGIKYKNIAAFADAFAQVAQAHSGIALDTSPLPPEEHKARVARAYAIVVPSVSEVNSNIIIEGVAMGKPFITTSDSGMHERLRDCGIFVNTTDPALLREAIERMLDEKTYKQYVERIRAFSYTRSMHDVAVEILNAVKDI